MHSLLMKLHAYWAQRYLVPKKIWILLLAYSLVAFSSPFPSQVTWVEIAIGSGLLLGATSLLPDVLREVKHSARIKWAVALAAILLFIPLLVGLLSGYALSNIVRDIVPLFFIFGLPVLFISAAYLAGSKTLSKLITSALVFVGIISTILFYFKTMNLMGSVEQLISFIHKSILFADTTRQSDMPRRELGEMLLKAYEPASLFTAIFLSAWGVIRIVRSARGAVFGVAMVVAGLLMAYQFMILGLRAYVLLFAFGIISVCISQIKSTGFYIRLLPLVLTGFVFLWPQIDAVFHLLWVKQQVTGTNGKAAEWMAVIGTVNGSPQTILFGVGWGGTVENPILGETTRFTHSILSYYLLKSGVIGFLLLLAVVDMLFSYVRDNKTVPFSISRWVFIISCMSPILIGVLFEPTFKTLSYGVILALLVLSNVSIAKKTVK